VSWFNDILFKIDAYFSENENLIIDEQKKEIATLERDYIILNEEFTIAQEFTATLQEKFANVVSQLSKTEIENYYLKGNSELDTYCSKNFKKIAPIAYKQKRDIVGTSYSIALSELVTPNSYEVKTFFKNRIKGDNTLDIAKSIGRTVGRYITWTSDKNLDSSGDYYLYPNETIAMRKGDCEDHAFVCMSGHPEIGGAWGHYLEGNSKFGHAYNVFIHKGELYILDSSVVGSTYTIGKFEDLKDRYQIDYIITRNASYKVDGSTTFGLLAGW
jgi:hypothetical protein